MGTQGNIMQNRMKIMEFISNEYMVQNLNRKNKHKGERS